MIIKLIRPYVRRPEPCLVLPIALVLHLLLKVDKACAFVDGKGQVWLLCVVEHHVLDLVFDAGGFEEAPR